MTELAVTMEQLIEAVKVLTQKFDALRDEKVAQMSEKIAVMETNLSRVQTVVYGALAAVGIQTLAGLAGLLVWLIKK